MDRITLTEYAKRRGVSKMAVSRAVRSGRLSRSVERDEQGRPWIADADQADREWAATTDLSKAPGYVKAREAARARGEAVETERDPSHGGRPPGKRAPAEDLDIGHESAREKHWKANRAEIEYREKIGELVNAEEMGAAVADAFARCRARLSGLPTRARQQIPHLTTEEVDLIDAFVREALEELTLKLEDEGDDEGDGDDAE